MTKTTLNEFISHVKNVGLPNTQHFFIIIPNQDKLTLSLCDQINLPGVSIMTGDIRMYGEGHEIPHAPLYAPVSASFIVDNNLSTLNMIKEWMNQVYDFKTRSPGYYDDYVRDVDIYIINKNGDIINQTRLQQCYPKVMQDIQLDYSAENVIKFTVQFVYKWSEKIEQDGAGNPIQETIISTSQGIQGMNPTAAATYVSGIPVISSTRSELQGVTTQITNNVPIINTINNNTVFNVASRAVGIQEFGTQSQDIFSRVFNQAVSVVRSLALQKMQPAGQLAFVTAFNLLGRDTRSLSQTIVSLGSAYATRPSPGVTVEQSVLNKKGAVASSITALVGSLTSLQSAFAQIGVPFSFPSQQLSALSSQFSAVTSLESFSQRMNDFGSVMSTIGAEINAAKLKVPQTTGPEFIASLNSMSDAILQAGTDIKNMSTVMK